MKNGEHYPKNSHRCDPVGIKPRTGDQMHKTAQVEYQEQYDQIEQDKDCSGAYFIESTRKG